MDPQLTSTLWKVLVPLAVIGLVLRIARWRGIAWRQGLGLRWPRASVAALWIAVWIAWMAAGELLIDALGMQQPARWPEYPPLIFGLRVAAIGLVGPACEELVMRGPAFERLRATRLRVAGTIVLTAAAWALMHYRYDPATIALIFADGLLLGLCRARSGSVLLPAVMHMLANLFSIWQSTHG